MNARIDRLSKEIAKTKAKISDLQAKQEEMEHQKTALENTEIVDVVRSMGISLTDLAEVIKAAQTLSQHNDVIQSLSNPAPDVAHDPLWPSELGYDQ